MKMCHVLKDALNGNYYFLERIYDGVLTKKVIKRFKTAT